MQGENSAWMPPCCVSRLSQCEHANNFIPSISTSASLNSFPISSPSTSVIITVRKSWHRISSPYCQLRRDWRKGRAERLVLLRFYHPQRSHFFPFDETNKEIHSHKHKFQIKLKRWNKIRLNSEHCWLNTAVIAIVSQSTLLIQSGSVPSEFRFFVLPNIISASLWSLPATPTSLFY